MTRRIACIVSALVLLCCGIVPVSQTARAAGNASNSFTCLVAMDHPAKFSFGGTEVLVCASTVQSGSPVQLVVRAHKAAQVHVQLLFPDGTSSVADAVADKYGLAHMDLAVDYNPISRYAQAQLIVTVTRPGHTDVVPGSVTIAQALPLGSTRLRARPSTTQAWCANDRGACSIRNGGTLIIQVDSDPGAQVNASLLYPDGTSLPCPANTLTGTAFTSNTGVYRCQLPIAYQGKDKGKGSTIVITAQVSAGGYTQSRTLRLSLAAR
jgi:hypothetical protein